MLVIQIIGILFVAFMAYYTFVHKKRGEFNNNLFILWEIIWGISFIVIAIPSVLTPIVETFKFARALDVLVILGIMLSLGMVFQSYIVSVRTEKRLEKLVRQIAIENVKTKKNKK